VNELSAFFRPTPVDSPACNNGCIAIDAYPEIINDRRRGPDSWMINPGYPLLFIDQNITCPSECVIAGQNSVESWYLRFKLSYRDLAELVRELGVWLIAWPGTPISVFLSQRSHAGD
jgi:hypothetical protein